MDVTLVYPPASDPRSPHLALPSLAAVLREAGVEVELLDLDLDGLLSVLTPDSLEQAGHRLRTNPELARRIGSERCRRLSAFSEFAPLQIANALSTMRDSEKFYDPGQLRSALDTISISLEIVSAATSVGVHYGISPIQYEVDGINEESLSDLIRISACAEANIFRPYWDRVLFSTGKKPPELTGISITNRQQMIPGLTLARQLRRHGHFVVLGGTLLSKFKSQLIRLPEFFEHFADGVVIHEGETALLELCVQMNRGRDFSKVPNFLYLTSSGVRFTQYHVEAVDRLPTPDFEGLPLHRYLTPEPVLPILFGKGCYFNRCKFCDIPYVNRIAKKAYRIRTPEKVRDDVRELYMRFGCRHFQFTDEALPPVLLEQLVDRLTPRDEGDISFVGYARIEPDFTPDRCEKLAHGGIRKLYLGLESGSQRMLDHMDKGISLSLVPDVLRNLADAGIRFHLFSILGFPEESLQDARETIAFFEHHADIVGREGNTFSVNPFGLELRTEYYEHAQRFGLTVDVTTASGDFVIGAGNKWTNQRGLRHEEVEDLLSEFHDRARRTFRDSYSGSWFVWPTAEEYSVLYATHHNTNKAQHRLAIPHRGEWVNFQLNWSPVFSAIEERDGLVRIEALHAQLHLRGDVYLVLSKLVGTPLEDAFSRTALLDVNGVVDENFMGLLEWLLCANVLQLAPANSDSCFARNDGGKHPCERERS